MQETSIVKGCGGQERVLACVAARCYTADMLNAIRLLSAAVILIVVGAFISADDISQHLREAHAHEFCGRMGLALVHVDDSARFAQMRKDGTPRGYPLCRIGPPETGDIPAPSTWAGRLYGAPLLALIRLF